VRGIDTDPARRALAAALLAFGQEIGAHVIAEGIETAAEAAAVRRIGVCRGRLPPRTSGSSATSR
jgi:EAL domain-containing protein (putative c-di-GMP-specific phosphodiesterase class I)